MTSHCSQILRRVASDIDTFADGRHIPRDVLDSMSISVELAYREVVALDATVGLNPLQTEAAALVRNCLATVRSFQELGITSSHSRSSQNEIRPVYSGLVGRPRFLISEEQLSFLIESRFSVPQISDMLGVSIRTVRRRMTEFGLSIQAEYGNFSDSELDALVRQIQQQLPMCGNRQMQGHLLSRGIRVQQIRVRDSQRRVVPRGSVMRRLHVLNRREYSVAAPLSLYHTDGHHKLIRY